MWLTMIFAGISAGLAGDWKDQPFEQRVNTDYTAFTPGKRVWQVGLLGAQYGLLDNMSVGIPATPLYFLRIPNVKAKITAIQMENFDVSVDASWYRYELSKKLTAKVRPIGATASWTPGERFGLHFGAKWLLASLDGEVTTGQINSAIQDNFGVSYKTELNQIFGSGGGVYAGATATAFSTRMAADLQLNRRDSLIFSTTSYWWLRGLVAGGVAVDNGTGANTTVGASVEVDYPLWELFLGANAMSWQMSWEHLHLRIGMPIPWYSVSGWSQAFKLYYVFGGGRD